MPTDYSDRIEVWTTYLLYTDPAVTISGRKIEAGGKVYAINELISLATHKFGRCVAIDDLFSMMITPDMDDELGGEVG